MNRTEFYYIILMTIRKHFLIYQRRDTHAFIYLLRKAHIMKPYEIKII